MSLHYGARRDETSAIDGREQSSDGGNGIYDCCFSEVRMALSCAMHKLSLHVGRLSW